MEPHAKRPKRSRSRRMRDSSPTDTPRAEHLEMVSEPLRKTPQRYASGLGAFTQGQHHTQYPAPLPGARLKWAQNATFPNFSTLTRKPLSQGYIPIQSPQPAVTAGNQQGLQHMENPFSSQSSLRAPSNLGRLLWPKIGFGDRAPRPRWLVNKENQPRGRWNLVWTFDAGPSAGWNQLSQDQLFEYAYKCLEDALDDPISREQFRFALTTTIATSNGGPAAVASVSNIEDPLPPLPTAPQSSCLEPQPGLHGIAEAPTQLEQASYYLPNYERPSTAVRPGLYACPSNLHVMAAKMFHQMKGTLGPPGSPATTMEQTGGGSPSLEEDKSLDSQSSSYDAMPSSRVRGVGEQYDPERLQDIPTSGRLSPLPPEDGGQIARFDLELFAEQEESEKDANQQLHSVEDPRSTNDSSNAPVAQRPNAEHFGLFDADGIERCYPNIGPKVGGATEDAIAERFMSRWATTVQHYPPDPEAVQYFEHMRLNHRRGGKDDFLHECLEISKDSVQRETYFPRFGPVRRLRSWAGSEVPAAVSAELRARVSAEPSSYRPFRSFQPSSSGNRASGPARRRGRRRGGTMRTRR